MNRRAFITLLSGAAAWPPAARAQQAAVPVVGFIRDGSAEANARNAAAFRKGLNETGYVEGQNVKVEFHWLEGQCDRPPALLGDLVVLDSHHFLRDALFNQPDKNQGEPGSGKRRTAPRGGSAPP